jgi:hypothetical protein
VLSWKEQLERSWLSDQRSVHNLDTWVRARLAGHRALAGAERVSVVAASVATLVEDIRRFGKENNWFWASCAICLLAELAFAAEEGGIFLGGTRVPENEVKPLRILRNALFHPAHHRASAGAGKPHVERLVEWLRENSDGLLAEELAENWSVLGQRKVAEFALRKLSGALQALARALRL